MRTVWKFQVPMIDTVTVKMPGGAKILHLAEQETRLCIWALVDPDRFDESRTFRIAGTGHTIEDNDWRNHVGSFLMLDGALVFHVFEINQP